MTEVYSIMKPIDRSEILGSGEYEQVRERFRARVIDKRVRRAIDSGASLLRLGVDHPAYEAEVDLSKVTRQSLAADLAGQS